MSRPCCAWPRPAARSWSTCCSAGCCDGTSGRNPGSCSAVADGIASLRDEDYSVSIAPPAAPSPTRRLVDAYNCRRAGAAHATTGPVPARAAARHRDPGHTARARADERARHGAVREPCGAPALRRRPQARGAGVRAACSTTFRRRCVRHSRRTAIRSSRWSFRGESQVFHLSQRSFLLNGQPHRLCLLKQLTRELNAREAGDLEARDPRDRPRDQQLCGADRVACAIGAAARGARRTRRSSSGCSAPSRSAWRTSPDSSRVTRGSRSCRGPGPRRCAGRPSSSACGRSRRSRSRARCRTSRAGSTNRSSSRCCST